MPAVPICRTVLGIGGPIARYSSAAHVMNQFRSRCNSIFIRCDDPEEPGADSCYEVNLFDTRPDKSYGTGAIVNVPGATVMPMPMAGGKWNVLEVEARGTNLIVRETAMPR